MLVTTKKTLVDHWLRAIHELGRYPKRFQDINKAQGLIKFLARSEKRGMRDLWDIFTKQREDLKKGLLGDAGSIVAYLLGFHLPNAYRALEMTRRLETRYDIAGLVAQSTSYELYDFGCGSGAVSDGVIAALNLDPKKTRINLVDTNRNILKAAALVHQDNGFVVKIQKKIEDVFFKQGPREADLHIVFLGYFWNELKKNPRGRKNLLAIIEKLAAKKCLIFFLEPANSSQAFEAMAARNDFVESGLKVLYPCPHDKACPLLKTKKDYCYSEFEWDRPGFQTIIDESLELSRKVLGCAGYIFASEALLAAWPGKQESKPVVVGQPVNCETEEREILLCTPAATISRVDSGRKRKLNGTAFSGH